MNIKTALKQLAADNDAHWTTAGLPRVDVVAQFAGVESLTREEIATAAPEFSRTNIEIPDAGEGEHQPNSLETPPVDTDTATGPKSLDAYDHEIKEVSGEIRDLTDNIEYLEARRKELQAYCDRKITERERVHPKPGSTEVMMQWQRAQHKQRMALALSLGAAPMSGRSDQPSPALAPIDQAYRDRRPAGFGTQPPPALPVEE